MVREPVTWSRSLSLDGLDSDNYHIKSPVLVEDKAYQKSADLVFISKVYKRKQIEDCDELEQDWILVTHEITFLFLI